MTSILERIAADGLTVSVSEDGNLDVSGEQSAVNSWMGTIKENKTEILRELRHRQVAGMLTADPGRKYATLIHDASTDPVLVTVGIRGLATFDLAIPHAHYDGVALLEVIEQHSAETESPYEGAMEGLKKPSGNSYPLSEAKVSNLGPSNEQRKAA